MNTETTFRMPRRAGEVMRATVRRRAEPLFGEFWREGELALMFGEPGVGKSLLAVQIADGIAKSGAFRMHGAQCTMHNGGAKRQKEKNKRGRVLYVDLVLSDEQFRRRYGRYGFSANLYRDCPGEGVDLAAWVREMVVKGGFEVVVIDDLSMVSRTDDGTRETLELMGTLRRLTIETGVSILVLADSFPFVYGDGLSERALRRSRVLCGIADSVFGLGFSTTPASSSREIVQTRSRSGEIVWTNRDPMRCAIVELDNGMLGMKFKTPELDEERVDLICRIRELHKAEGKSFREIAEELEISKSTAARLYGMWNEALQQTMENGRSTMEGPKTPEPELEFWQLDDVDPNVNYDMLYHDHPELEEQRHKLTLDLLAKYRYDREVPLMTEDDWDPRCLEYDLPRMFEEHPHLPEKLADIPAEILEQYHDYPALIGAGEG